MTTDFKRLSNDPATRIALPGLITAVVDFVSRLFILIADLTCFQNYDGDLGGLLQLC
jgi:hypothetical protein